MFATRASQQALRRLAAAQSTTQLGLTKFAAPAVLNSSRQTRTITDNKMTPTADTSSILIAQRKVRPTSPHLGIYKWEIPMTLSITNRITGCILSGGFYIFGSLYLVAPLLGLNLSSASMAAAFGAWPLAAKVATKFALAFPFTFHSFNGVRHLIWDTGRLFTKDNVVKSGWTVVGISVVSALGLSVFL